MDVRRPDGHEPVVVARFQDFAEAHVALGAIRAAGITAWLFDANHVGTAPHLSIGVGIRLAVQESDADAAVRILDHAVSADGAELCPECGSPRIRRKRRIWVALLHLLVAGIPVSTPVNRKRYCYNCGHAWKSQPEDPH